MSVYSQKTVKSQYFLKLLRFMEFAEHFHDVKITYILQDRFSKENPCYRIYSLRGRKINRPRFGSLRGVANHFSLWGQASRGVGSFIHGARLS